VPFTPEYEAELVAATLEAADRGELIPVYVGRPSLSGNPGASNRINLRVDDATYVRVHALAARQKRPVSEVVRDAIKDYLAAS
jgi:predicted transcriptional regulator